MDKEKTLQQIVKKAEEGGFDMKPYLPAFPNKKIVGKFLQVIYKEFIYTHEFAKSYWGETLLEKTKFKKRAWQYYLQRMMLEKDHIKYLSKFLKK